MRPRDCSKDTAVQVGGSTRLPRRDSQRFLALAGGLMCVAWVKCGCRSQLCLPPVLPATGGGNPKASACRLSLCVQQCSSTTHAAVQQHHSCWPHGCAEGLRSPTQVAHLPCRTQPTTTTCNKGTGSMMPQALPMPWGSPQHTHTKHCSPLLIWMYGALLSPWNHSASLLCLHPNALTYQHLARNDVSCTHACKRGVRTSSAHGSSYLHVTCLYADTGCVDLATSLQPIACKLAAVGLPASLHG